MGYLDENYKFVQYQNGDCELTDRKNDPQERINMAADLGNKDLTISCREKLLMEVLETGSRFPVQISHA